MKHKEVARRRGSVIPSLNKRLNISKLEKQQARYEARGRLSPSRLKSDSWLLTSNINAGLSYSERDGVSGNVGLNYGLGKNPKTGLSLGVSYNRQDGMGASVGLTSRGGVLRDTGANITRTEYSGFGADISSREYGPGKFSGGLSYNQRDGFTASLNVAGTNALNYNSQTGLSSNTDFISQYSMN
ncbi:peptidase M23, partial [Leptospira weilii serovar Heyan]